MGAVREFIKSDTRVLIIYSFGGVGKARFVIEVCQEIGSEKEFGNVDFLFGTGKKNVIIDEIVHEISEGKENIIVLDDAHIINNLTDFQTIFSERHQARMILTTRSTALEHVEKDIGLPAKKIELQPLDRDSSTELLEENLQRKLLDEYLRMAASICEGNPLLLGITVHLINSDAIESFDDIRRNDLVRFYFQGILAEIKQNKSEISLVRYEPYLALVFLLRPFSINDSKTRAFVRKIVGIDEVQESFMLRDLEKSSVLERYGDTLWIYPDLLGEYLLEDVFFSDISVSSFDEIFQGMPSSKEETVLKTLRDLNSSKSNLFLRRWASSILENIEKQNNDQRYDSLKQLAIVASKVSDETFKIIRFLSDPKNEKRPTEYKGLWPHIGKEHQTVLLKCIDILSSSQFDRRPETILPLNLIGYEIAEQSQWKRTHMKTSSPPARHYHRKPIEIDPQVHQCESYSHQQEATGSISGTGPGPGLIHQPIA